MSCTLRREARLIICTGLISIISIHQDCNLIILSVSADLKSSYALASPEVS